MTLSLEAVRSEIHRRMEDTQPRNEVACLADLLAWIDAQVAAPKPAVRIGLPQSIWGSYHVKGQGEICRVYASGFSAYEDAVRWANDHGFAVVE